MSDVAIKVEELGKRYRIGTSQQSSNGRRSLVQKGTAPFRYLATSLRKPSDEEIIWALRDVSFQVIGGEVLGIVGPNGAGKSTLLKILSRITEPTEGRILLDGRVGSLLEVGTGFHQELTGRENVYLNGAILGMRRAEIERKFEEIVDFAGVEKFIDTPVKRYSSGMYVRLAFAVAAHLETEILLVDEVLAVGDASFQKKCLGKMGDIATQGRTVLFVSHNMAAISNLCTRAMRLDSGTLVGTGEPHEVVSNYIDAVFSKPKQRVDFRSDRLGAGPLRFTDLQLLSPDGRTLSNWPSGAPGQVILEYHTEHSSPAHGANVGFSVEDSAGVPVFQCWTALVPDWVPSVPAVGKAVCKIPRLPLKAGRYSLNMYAEVGGETSDWIVGAATLDVVDGDFFGSGKISKYNSAVLVDHSWELA